MTKRKWLKVLANMGLTFVTTMTGNMTFDRCLDAGIPFWKMLGASCFTALLFALVVLFRELKTCASEPPEPPADSGCDVDVPKSRKSRRHDSFGFVLCLFGV
jgi:hypothetical protein